MILRAGVTLRLSCKFGVIDEMILDEMTYQPTFPDEAIVNRSRAVS